MSEIDALKKKASQCEDLVEQWFVETFHGSVVARSTEVWNAVHAAKEDLKRRLTELVGCATPDHAND
jgi:hypothetical protein